MTEDTVTQPMRRLRADDAVTAPTPRLRTEPADPPWDWFRPAAPAGTVQALQRQSQQQERVRLAETETMPRVRPVQRGAQQGPGAHRKVKPAYRPDLPEDTQPQPRFIPRPVPTFTPFPEAAAVSADQLAVLEFQYQEGNYVHPAGPDDRSLRNARSRGSRARVRPVAQADVAALTLTVVIPAHNEERDLGNTLASLLRQTVAPDRIIVVDDGSTDGTSAVAARYPVEVVRNEVALGNKARVVNFVAPGIDTDLIINIDADTILADDYLELVKVPFADPKVAIAAGIVMTWNPKGAFQRSRSIEYLFGQHLYRPIQNSWSSITVCPGCACVYRTEPFVKAGGFPNGTIAEDMGYTLSAVIAGWKTSYVPAAECYVVDPKNAQQLKAQLWRWLTGYYQCIRIYGKRLIKANRILALLILASMWDVFSLPLLMVAPFILEPSSVSTMTIVRYIAVAWFSTDLLITLPVVLYGARKRKISMWWVLANFPLIWVNRPFNLYYSTKALVWELFLVPLGWKKSLGTWIKGH